MADYYINSDRGKELANSLRAGDMAEASDGSLWRKEADGSISVIKNGQTMIGRVGVSPSAPSVSDTQTLSAPSPLETPALDAARRSDPSYSLQQKAAAQVRQNLASEKAKQATQNVTSGLTQENTGEDLLAQATESGSYTIGSAEGVYWADTARPGNKLGGRDGSIWTLNGYDDVTVEKDGKTYKAKIDRAAAKRDTQWAVLTAPPAEESEDTGTKKSKKKSSGTSSGSGSSGSLNTYFSGVSTGTKKETVQAASGSTGGDVASLRKKAASAQKDMADIARQISAAKMRGKDTAALEAKYAEAKDRYNKASAQVTAAKAPKNEGPTLIEAATSAPEKRAAVRKAVQRESWRGLPTVADADRFSVNRVSDAAARKEAQKNAWRSLPTVRDSDRFNLPSQTDSLIQQAIAQAPRTLSGKPYLPENDGGFSHSSGTSKSVKDRLAAQQMNIAMANDDYDTIRRIREQNNYLDDNESFKYMAGRAKTGLLGAIQGVGNALSYLFQAKEPEGYDWDNPVMTGEQFAESVSGLKQTFSFADTDAQKFAQRYAGRNIPAAQRTAGSVAEGVAGMIPTIAANIAVPGSSLYVLFTQAAGSATTDALQRGASGQNAVAYGVANGALEVLTEKMFDGVAGVFGKGAADDALQSLVRRVTQNEGAQNALLTIADSLGEGFEEFVSEFGDKVLADLLLKDDDRNFRLVLADAGESFLVGALTSAVMQAAGSITKNTTPKKAAEKVNDILQEDIRQEGINANVREAAQQSALDRGMLETMRPQAFQTPTWAELLDTQQTTQATAERGADGVATGGEINKNSAAPEQTTESPINGPVRSDAAEAGNININDGYEKIKSEFKKLIEKNNRSLSVNQLVDYGSSLDKADAQLLMALLDDIDSGKTPYKYDAAGTIRKIDPSSHIDNRDMSMRMKRGQHSFQYDNPEIHEYMKEAAEMLLEEIQNSTRGERFATPVEDGDNGGYYRWTGTKRHTTDGIAYLKDNFGISWDNLAKAAEAIIKDNGAENYADANRVEMLLDDMLTYGYQSLSNQNEFHSYSIPPNEAYIAAKSAIPGASGQYTQESAMDLLFEEMDNAENESRNNTGATTQLPDANASWFTANTDSANMTPNANVAQQGNSVNQNISPTDSTGAAPSGFDPLSHASNQYGAIPPGEKASRVIDIPASMDGETKVRRFTRTTAEAQITTDEMVNRIEKLVTDGKLDYEVYGNKQAIQDGAAAIEKQYARGKTIEQIRSEFIRDANNGKAGAKFVAQGTTLYADAIAAGDYQTASDIFVALAAVETNAGQTVQAARLLKSMSPEGRIFTVQKMVSNLEAQINQRRSANKQIEIDVPDALLNAYQNATTETAQQAALDNIYQNIADQVPTTLREGLQQWRYFSMLANPSTHAKNIMGNVSGAAAKIGKDNVAALLETIFIGDKPGQRTKAFLNLASEADQNLLSKAWADYDTAAELFEDSVGKYSQASGEINDRRRYWKINDPKNAVTKGIDKALGAAEKVSDFNTKALEVEDMWFSKPMYATALASYMKANHLTEITDAARTYAMSEAKRGTFNDLNAVSKWASQLGNDSKIGRFLAGTIYPFKKVPANVMVRTVEYSPLGFAKGVYDLVQMSRGNTDYTAAKAIDDFAAGATGTALLGIGIAMAKHGILRATGIGDDKEKEQQKNAFGAKDFSILVGDTYIPIDSFTLTGTGLLTGAQIWEAVQNAKNGDEPVSLEDILDALSKITDPVFEQSMLTGLDSVISTIKNSGSDVGTGEMLAKLGILIVGNYIGQYVPTLVGRTASSLDRYQRSTYIEPDGPWDPIQSAIQGIQKKVPGWRQQMAVTYGNWGVPVEGNGAGSTASAIGKAVTPVYPSQKKTDPVEEEIARLHDVDSAYSNFYKRPSKTISVDGQSVKLTSKQYGDYVVARGQTDYTLRNAMLENELYQSLPDQIKSKAMEMSQAYANEIGREAAGVGYKSSEKWVNDLKDASQEDVLNAVLKRAVESAGYISQEYQAAKDSVDNLYGSAAYARQSLDLVKSAKEKANTYFEHASQAKYGGELTEAEQELAGKNSEYIADYFMRKAIDGYKNADGTTGHLSGENAVKYSAVAKSFDTPLFSAVTDDLLAQAKKKAHAFYTEVEKTDFGGVMSADNRALNRKFAKMDNDEIAQYFLSVAAKEKYKDTNGNGTNLDEAAAALKSGDITDSTVFAFLDSDIVEDYRRYGKGSSITPEILLHAARAKKTVKQDTDQDGVVVNTSQEQFEDWVNRQSWTQTQKQDVMKVFYPNTAEKKNYLVESLNSGKMKYTDAKKELTPTLQAGWTHQLLPTLAENANDTTKGVLMSQYIEAAAAYDDRPNASERKALNYSYAWQWFCDYLNTTDMTREQKYQVALIMSGTDSQKTKDKIWSRLR